MSEYFIRDGKSWFRFSTGREIEIQQVSPMTLEAAAATVEKPKAPLQDIIDTNTGKVVGQERNEAHPDHKADLEEWEEKRMEAASKAAEATKEAAGKAVEVTKEAADKAAEATKEAASKAAEATKEAASKATEATKDAVKK